MQFRVVVTTGSEVNFAGESTKDRPTYYGGPPTDSGMWRINMPAFEAWLAARFAPLSLGSSIHEFVFGFEVAVLDEWGDRFKATRDYVSYRPAGKRIVSVGQLEWMAVKDLGAKEQLALLGEALVAAIERVNIAKRKPRDFDAAGLADAARIALLALDPADVTISPSNVQR